MNRGDQDQTVTDPDAAVPTEGLGARAAAALVFGSSAAVLVVELVALRLLAPYLGLTLETSTLVIGVALTAIAVGAWVGGRVADGTDPRRLLGPLLVASGVCVSLMPVVVRGGGELAGAGVFLIAAAAIFVPGAMLSAISPIVATLRLTDLSRTGSVVGGLSGVGTLGAIAGTVLTGFVFVTAFPVSAILVGLGAMLVLAGVVVGIRLGRGVRSGPDDRDDGGSGSGSGSRSGPARSVAPALLLVPGLLGAAWGPGSCDVETTYHCARVVTDDERPSGRVLVLDGLRHSYVDLEDPTHLEFDYIAALASVADTAFPEGEPISAYHLGGGGLTIPRYLAEVRPGTTSVVSEIDSGVLDVDVAQLALETGPGLEVRIEDGRLGIAKIPSASQDVVVGDAFGGVSVPWHLTTREAMTEVRRVLAPGGLYAANLIDFGPMQLVRAEIATLRTVFDHVVLVAGADVLDGAAGAGGNVVVIASQEPVDRTALAERLAGRVPDWRLLDGPGLDDWVGDAMVLTDDHAPVDQLLTPHAAVESR